MKGIAVETFTDKLVDAIRAKRSILCGGLDPQLKFMPPQLRRKHRAYYHDTFEAVGRIYTRFNAVIIDAIAPYVIAVKPNKAFYEMYGYWGDWAFEQTVQYARKKGLLIIGDAKRGDGGDTAEAYAQGYLGEVPFFKDLERDTSVSSPMRVDALTVNAWIGTACLDPFIEMVKTYGSGVFVVDKTSFSPDSVVEQLVVTDQELPNWQVLAHLVQNWGEGTEGEEGWRNLGVVMGATKPTDAPIMRRILPNSWFLVPGYGAQGAPPDDAVLGANDEGLGITVNSARYHERMARRTIQNGTREICGSRWRGRAICPRRTQRRTPTRRKAKFLERG